MEADKNSGLEADTVLCSIDIAFVKMNNNDDAKMDLFSIVITDLKISR